MPKKTLAGKGKNGRQPRFYHNLWFMVAGTALVVICAWALRSKRVSATDLPPELRKLLRCGEICDIGASDEDRAFAEGARKHRDGHLDIDHTEDIIKVCMWRCREGHKESITETHGVASAETYKQMPSTFHDFVATARRCASAGFRKGAKLVQGLEQCGVVHLEDAVPMDLVAEVYKEFRSIRANSTEDSRRTDAGNLRGGRLETWLPFQPPFSDIKLLQMRTLMSAIKAYLGPDAVLDHMSVITAAGKSSVAPQKLHADVGFVRQHLEVHIPLVDVTAKMGPTVFCPATHGLAQKGKAGWTSGVERALSLWYLTPVARCADDSLLSYARPLKRGQATIYDANVFHGGTANRAKVDRPILQLSYSMSASEVAERDYLKGSFEANPAAKELAVESVEAFRKAFVLKD